jgi:hypothetical protein
MSDSDYTLTSDVREDIAESAADAARGGSPLSKSHIGRKYRIDPREGLVKVGKPPSVSWCAGASILKTSQGSDGEQVGGGIRKTIAGFSNDSRRRLMYTIASIRRDAVLPFFVTLTYPKEFPSPMESKRHLKMFKENLKYKFPGCGSIWKLEPQERGAPHYHMLVWNVEEDDLRMFVPYAWYAIAGNQDENHLFFHRGQLGNQHCVSAVRSWRGVWSYASKYLGKTFEVAGWDNVATGRFWGFVNKKNIPFGVLHELELPKKKVSHIMRYQRRFSKRKIGNQGFTLFCDADQWIENISSEVRQVK